MKSIQNKKITVLLFSIFAFLMFFIGAVCVFDGKRIEAKAENYTIDYTKITTTKDLIKDYRGGASFTPGGWEIVHTDLNAHKPTPGFALKVRVDFGGTWGGDPNWYGESTCYFRFFGTTLGGWDESPIITGDDGFMFNFAPRSVPEICFKGGEVNMLYTVTENIEVLTANNNIILEIGSYDIGDGTSVIYGKIDDLVFVYATYATGTFTFGRYVSIGSANPMATYDDSSKPAMLRTPLEDDDIIHYGNITVYDVVKDFNGDENIEVKGALSTINFAETISSVNNVAIKTRIFTGDMYNIFNQRYFQFFAQDGTSGVPNHGVDGSAGVLIVFYDGGLSIMMVGGDDYYSHHEAGWIFIEERPNVSAEREFDVLDLKMNTYVDLEVGTFSINSAYDAIYVKINEYLVRLRYYTKNSFAFGKNFSAKVDYDDNPAVLQSAETAICKMVYSDCDNGYVIGDRKVFAGETVTINAIPNTGYKLDQLFLNGVVVNLNDVSFNFGALNIGEYSFVATSKTTVKATFVKDSDCALEVFDFFDISGTPQLDIENVQSIYTFGQMPKKFDAAFKMVFNPGNGFNYAPDAQRQFGFFQESGYPLWSQSGFEVSFYWQSSANFKMKGWGYDGIKSYGSREAYLAPGTDAVIEMGNVDIDDTYAAAYIKVDNYLIILERYEKAGYSVDTGVGGLYISSNEDIVAGGISVKTAYVYREAEFEDLSLKDNFEILSKYIIADKPLEILAKPGYVINEIIIKNATDNTVYKEFNAQNIVNRGASYFITADDSISASDGILIALTYSFSDISVNVDCDNEKVSVLSGNSIALRDDYVLAFSTDVGYVADKVILNGRDVTALLNLKNGIYTYTEYFTTDDLDFDITVKEQSYSVSAVLKDGSVGATISVIADGISGNPKTVKANGTVTLKVLLTEDYIIKKITLNNKEIFVNATGEYSLYNVSEDVSFIVETEKDQSATDNGSGCSSSINELSVSDLSILCSMIFAIIVITCRKKHS